MGQQRTKDPDTTHTSSHLLLCFIRSYIRQNRSTKIDQHLLILTGSPGTQSILSLTPEASLSPSSLREMSLDFYFQNTYPPCMSLDPITRLQKNRVLMMRPCSSPSQKARLSMKLLKEGIQRPLLEWVDLLRLVSFESLALWPCPPVAGVSRLSGPPLLAQHRINTLVTPGAMDLKWGAHGDCGVVTRMSSWVALLCVCSAEPHVSHLLYWPC